MANSTVWLWSLFVIELATSARLGWRSMLPAVLKDPALLHLVWVPQFSFKTICCWIELVVMVGRDVHAASGFEAPPPFAPQHDSIVTNLGGHFLPFNLAGFADEQLLAGKQVSLDEQVFVARAAGWKANTENWKSDLRCPSASCGLLHNEGCSRSVDSRHDFLGTKIC
eukprot:scaffold23295_cov31-Prasinocladus_malaysianus.AAC.2